MIPSAGRKMCVNSFVGTLWWSMTMMVAMVGLVSHFQYALFVFGWLVGGLLCQCRGNSMTSLTWSFGVHFFFLVVVNLIYGSLVMTDNIFRGKPHWFRHSEYMRRETSSSTWKALKCNILKHKPWWNCHAWVGAKLNARAVWIAIVWNFSCDMCLCI